MTHRTAKSSVTILAVIFAFNAGLAPAEAEDTTVGQKYPHLSSGVLAPALLTTLPTGVVLRSGEMKITQKDLDSEIQKSPQELWPQLKRNLFFVLENLAGRILLQAEAAAWAAKNGKVDGSADTVVRAYLESIADGISVGDDELRKFYDDNKDTVGEADFEQVKNDLRSYLLDQKRAEAVEKLIRTLGERFELEVDSKWTAKQNEAANDNDVDRARASGLPSLVDFGAGGCRACEMMAPILASLKEDYAGLANIVYIDVRKEQILAARYGVQSIPVQIFFDKSGREVFRHVGFLARGPIEAKLAELGAKR